MLVCGQGDASVLKIVDLLVIERLLIHHLELEFGVGQLEDRVPLLDHRAGFEVNGLDAPILLGIQKDGLDRQNLTANGNKFLEGTTLDR